MAIRVLKKNAIYYLSVVQPKKSEHVREFSCAKEMHRSNLGVLHAMSAQVFDRLGGEVAISMCNASGLTEFDGV